MRSVESVYRKIQDGNINLATYPCLARAVKGRQFSRKSLLLAFKKLMPKHDYVKKERKELIDSLQNLTDTLVQGEI